MNNEQIIQKIKDDKLKPISRSFFLFKKVVVWFLLVISTIFGAYAFAFFFLKIMFIDFDNWYFMSNSYDRFLVENIPIIWLVLFLFSLICIYFLFKKTNKGYKHSVLFIASLSLIISFVLGMALSKILAHKGVLIERFENEKMMRWTNPDSGRLSGEVMFMDDNYILLRDIKDDVWNVNIDYILDDSIQVLNNHQMIYIIGRLDYENNFTACQILPLDMDKKRFRPNPKLGIERKKGQNKFVQDLCDFVINPK